MIVTKSYTFTGDVPIPDFSVDPNGISNVLKVIGIPDGVEIKHIAVNLNVDHTWDADLDISLIDPQGTTIDLSSDNGGPGDNYTNTTFDDGATNAPIKGLPSGATPFTGIFKPEQPLSNLYPGNAEGDWTLKIAEDTAALGDQGSLKSWTLNISFETPDIIIGDENSNTLNGTIASETLLARRGNDIIMGNGGNDNEVGGLGDDEFHFNFEIKPENLAFILDFTSGDDHVVVYEGFLNGFKSKWFNGSDELKNKFFNLDKKPHDKKDIFTYKEKTGELFYDANGKKGGFDKDGLFATVVPHTHIEASDLMIHA
jgi:subtilisin-like proprotein convertase family protein